VPRTSRAVLTLLAAALLALAVAACGGSGSSGGSGDATSILAQTFGPNKPIKSGRLDVDLALDVKGVAALDGPVSLKLTGPFQSQGAGKLPQFDVTADIKLGSERIAAGLVSTGDKGYLTFQGQAYALSGELFKSFRDGFLQSQKQAGSKSGGQSLAALGIDPGRWLKDPKTVGEEQVGGVDTIHVTAGIDVENLLTDVSTLLGKAGSLGQGAVPTKLTPTQRQQIASAVKDATVDVYTGKDDKTLRRLTLDVAIDVPSDLRSKVGGLSTGTVKLDLTIADLNKPQTVTAPTNARPMSELTTALRALLGGTDAGAASSGGGSGSGSAAPSASSRYLDCLQQAGNDVAKVQKCAALLNQ
jgi:hypothetical protein